MAPGLENKSVPDNFYIAAPFQHIAQPSEKLGTETAFVLYLVCQRTIQRLAKLAIAILSSSACFSRSASKARSRDNSERRDSIAVVRRALCTGCIGAPGLLAKALCLRSQTLAGLAKLFFKGFGVDRLRA